MEGFEFGNARVRAMKSRLLSAEALGDLIACTGIPALTVALTVTPYGEAIEAALLRHSGAEVINDALRRDLIAKLGKLPSFYEDQTRTLLELALGQYELHNVVTVLRGITRETAASDTAVLMMPVYGLSSAELGRLARAPEVRTAINLLASWQSPLAVPLLEATATRPQSGLPFLELALKCWYFETIAGAENDSPSWQRAMVLETDVANLLTALRLVGHPEALSRLENAPPVSGTGGTASGKEDLFCGMGRLGQELLWQAARQATITAAASVLAGTEFYPVLQPVVAQSEASPTVSALEHALLEHQLRVSAQLYSVDPLGMGIPLGYLRMKTTEAINIRLIAQRAQLGIGREWLDERLLLLPEQRQEVRRTAKAQRQVEE